MVLGPKYPKFGILYGEATGEAAAGTVVRVAGADRYATADAVAARWQ